MLLTAAASLSACPMSFPETNCGSELTLTAAWFCGFSRPFRNDHIYNFSSGYRGASAMDMFPGRGVCECCALRLAKDDDGFVFDRH